MTKDAATVAIGILVLNGLGEYYGVGVWSPFRLVPNLIIVFYAIYRILRRPLASNH